MSSNVIYLDQSNFENEVLNTNKLVMVDFYADWCMPCKMLSPILEELANTNDIVKIAKLNVDNARNISAQYRVSGIPNIIFFKNGEVVGNIVGLRSKDELQNVINNLK